MIDKNCVFCGEELHSVIKEPDFKFLHLLEMGTELVNNSDLPVLFGGACCKCMASLERGTLDRPICGVDLARPGAAVFVTEDELREAERVDIERRYPMLHVNCRSAGVVFVSTPMGGSRRREELMARRLPRLQGEQLERFFNDDEFRRNVLRERPNLENFFRDNYGCVPPDQAEALGYFRQRFGEVLLAPIPIRDDMTPYERGRAETFNRQLAEYLSNQAFNEQIEDLE